MLKASLLRLPTLVRYGFLIEKSFDVIQCVEWGVVKYELSLFLVAMWLVYEHVCALLSDLSYSRNLALTANECTYESLSESAQHVHAHTWVAEIQKKKQTAHT